MTSHRRDRRHDRSRGITFIDLCIYLAIISIVTSLVVPPFERLLQRSKATSSINWILGAVNLTRLSAMHHHAYVTLCPTRDQERCGGDWNSQLIVFVDSNRNRVIDGKDFIVSKLSFPQQAASLKWRSFRNRQYLQMTPEGYTNYQNGNFTYCPEDGDKRYARQLVINMQGRVRMARDRDGDGIVEDTRGRPVSC